MKVISMIFCFALLMLNGCEMRNKKELDFFDKNVNQMLDGSDQVSVLASDLTNFSWSKLCFKRKKYLELSFHTENGEVIFNLDYEDYFVDEPYVDGSLDDKCINSNERLLLKKMYEGHSKPVEFFKEN